MRARRMAGLAARLAALALLVGCAHEMTAGDVELFQPPIVATAAPATKSVTDYLGLRTEKPTA